ncbi:tetratricopeptide repeat protein [Cytophaga aurantiaca]|uniref:tetratricopeptide repeat protein n=1 Tax=Cytophaga aurantiaca TaxID=29530 RepID=UPI00036FB0D2|nr:tetratricopeptide repeat protein [Cytophaga aurantiaca]
MKYFFALLFICASFFQTQAEENPKLTEAEAAFESKNFQNAIVLYTELIESKEISDCSYVFFKRGFSYYYLANYKAAKADFKTALKVSPENKNYNYIRGASYWTYGRIYSKLNKPSKAVKLLLKSKEYLQSSDLYSTLGYNEIKLKKYKDALAHLDIAISGDNKNAYAYNNRALVYIKLNQLDKAREDVEQSKLLNNRNPYVFKHSALIYIQLKKYDMACMELQKAKDLGYADFLGGHEADRNEVDHLMNTYCR